MIVNKERLGEVIKYLKVARVLISSNDMEEIIGERDINYGEENEIDKCIEYVTELMTLS